MDFLNNAVTRLVYFALFLGLIPRPWALGLADAIGRVWYLLDKRHRNVALDNLGKAYAREKTASEIRVIARTAFQNTVRALFEIGWSLGLDLPEVMRHCRVHGLEHLRQAYAKGRGFWCSRSISATGNCCP